MSCTEASCSIPVRMPGGETTRGSIADVRATVLRRAPRSVILRGAISITPSISAPEGTSCGCSTGCGGESSCGGGCGPSCGCGPCRARWGGESDPGVIDDSPIQTVGMDPITAQMVGYPRGYNSMVEGRNRAAERAEGIGPQPEVAAVVPSGGMRAPKQGKTIIARGAMGAMGSPASQGYPAEGGLTPDGIADLQRKLTLLGFTGDCGYTNRPLAADGVIGNSTRLAVRAFQRAQGLAVDGTLWPQTQAAIHAAWGNRPATDADIAVAYDALYQKQSADMAAAAALRGWYDPEIPRVLNPSGDVRPPWAMSYTPAQWSALGPNAREAARVMHAARSRGAMPAAPSGALAAPQRSVPSVPWSMLSDADRASLVAGAARYLGTAPSGVALPPWAATTYSQQQWDDLRPEQRLALEQQHAAAQPGQGWAFAGGILQAGSQIATSIINGDMQREVERLRIAAQTGQAQAAADLARFQQESNERIARLQAEANTNPNNAAQLQAMIATLQNAQNAAAGNSAAMQQFQMQMQQMQMQQRGGGNATLLLGAGVLGLGALFLLRKK